jgi:hypothetical protein
MGAATCSAMGCHNANGPLTRPKGSEYSIWASQDRHTKGYAVLFDKRSETMVRNLYGTRAKPASETELCLKCHAMNNGKEDTTTAGDHFYLGDGVGCESCHGPAEKYLSEHYRAGFQEKSSREKADEYGLWDTKDLASRARVCATCHVGSAEKDVNHDIIAAGHPRLNFELSGFLALYPKHWINRDNDAEVWAVGQVASASAALHLLEARAADQKKPWPEFAEYACYACHKDLPAELPSKEKYTERTPGSLPWGAWYLEMLSPLSKDHAGEAKLPTAVETLRRSMQAASPNRTAVAEQTGAVARRLDAWTARGGVLQLDSAQSLLRSLAREGAAKAYGLDWDQATQLYLALTALDVGLESRDPTPALEKVRGELKKMAAELKGSFEPGYNSPRQFARKARPFLAEHLNVIDKLLDKN